MVTDLTGCFTPSKSTGPDAMEVERKVGGARNGPRWSQKGCGTLRFRPNLDSQRRAASRLLTRTLQSIHIQIVRPLPPSPCARLDDFKHESEKVLSCSMERQCIDHRGLAESRRQRLVVRLGRIATRSNHCHTSCVACVSCGGARPAKVKNDIRKREDEIRTTVAAC